MSQQPNTFMNEPASNKPLLRIAIDGNEANVTNRVGSNFYAFELLTALERVTRKRADLHFTILLSSAALSDFPATRNGWQYQVITPKPFWTQFALPIHLFFNQKKYDVFFTPGHYGPRVSSVPYVSSVMDLAYLEFPRQFKKKDYLQLKEWTRYSVKNAKKVIAISEFTKNDVVAKYGIKPQDVVIAYPGLPKKTAPGLATTTVAKHLKELGVHDEFFLYVGTLQPRKNLLRLIEAFEIFIKKSQAEGEKIEKEKKKKRKISLSKLRKKKDVQIPKYQLVIAGKIGWLAEEILDKVQSSPYRERIVLTGYVTEEQKVALFQECAATFLVGLYEGFGIPALEAMSYGSIPVVSSTTSLPEVVGQGGILIDPQNEYDIAKAMSDVLSFSAKEHATLLKKGREQVKKFRWETSAGLVLRTLESVGGK